MFTQTVEIISPKREGRKHLKPSPNQLYTEVCLGKSCSRSQTPVAQKNGDTDQGSYRDNPIF